MATKLRVRNSQPPVDPKANWRPKSVLDDYADSRDFLSTLVGGGHLGIGDNVDLQTQFRAMSERVGTPLAQKLAAQAILFNQRPDAQKLPVEDRVKHFFSLGSNDPEVSQYLKNSGAIGEGSGIGFRNSTLITNSQLQNKSFAEDETPQKKIKLIVKK